jgi:hypothetical protein
MILAPLLLATEFFIVSSVDTSHARVVLKRPTEVTVVVTVPATTPIRTEHGQPLHLGDLRSGDTIYAVVNSAGVATSIRRGPMTMEELRRRYLPSLP